MLLFKPRKRIIISESIYYFCGSIGPFLTSSIHSVYISASGHQFWSKNGLKHRGDDLPAVIGVNGDKEWWVNGEQHRNNDLPTVIYPDRHYKAWHKNGRYIAEMYTVKNDKHN